mgnify:CR=1 FL=1
MTDVDNYKQKKMVAFLYKLFSTLLFLFVIAVESLFLYFI